MHNTPKTMVKSSKDMDVNTLQKILQHKQKELETCEYPENSYDTDPDHFLSSIVNNKCNYYTQEQFDNTVKSDGKLSIIHFNCRSLYAHFSTLKEYLQTFSHPFNIVALTETWLNTALDFDFELDGYEFRYLNRENKTHGGVALFIHKSLKFDVVNSMTVRIDGIMECLTVEIYNDKKKNVVISCVYRTPNTSIEIFKDWMEKLYSTVNRKSLFICGDFNIDLLNPTKLNSINDFLDTMYSLSLYPTITKPSRITSHSATIIDNIFTNNMENLVTSGLLICDLSDHLPVFSLYDYSFNNKISVKSVYKRIRTEETISDLNHSLSNHDWSPVYQEHDVDIAYKKFLDTFVFLYNKHCPVKVYSKKEEHKRHPWLTKGIINACKKKNNLYKKFITLKTDEAEQKYKKYRNKLTDIIRSSKQLFYRKILYENKNNIKGTWDILNRLIKQGSSKSSYPDYFVDKNGKVHNIINIVNKFNNFFVNVGPDLAAQISDHGVTLNPTIKQNSSSLFLSATSEQEVTNTVLNFKSKVSTDCHDIDMFLVKKVISNIVKPLTHVCNLSFQSGCFPNEMKIAKVIPIFKSDDKHSFTNYRPISLLPQFSKILEKLFNTRLENFLEKHQIINERQYGFRTDRTTSMAIIEATEEITNALDRNEYAIGIFIDLKKAFDTINHSILLNKLEQYGIRGVAGDWLKSYLTGRVQYVKMGQHASQSLGIVCGVPQGSVLGPKLFNVYINDIFSVSQSLKLILFADDTNIFYSSNNYHELLDTVNKELNTIKKWLDRNKLSLNIDKTKVMMFGNPTTHTDLAIFIEGRQIENVCENKFLGVIIDSKLTWKSHISHIKTKISKSLSVINKVKQCLDMNALRTLYCTLVLPYFTYCVEIWGNTYQCTIDPLVLLQKRALRIIHKAGFREHTHNLFIQSKLLKIVDIVKYYTSIILYKAFNKLLPTNLQTFFKIKERTHDLRGHGNFIIPYGRSNRKRFCVTICGVILWNNLGSQYKQCQNIRKFKLLYKRMVWSQYSESEA